MAADFLGLGARGGVYFGKEEKEKYRFPFPCRTSRSREEMKFNKRKKTITR